MIVVKWGDLSDEHIIYNAHIDSMSLLFVISKLLISGDFIDAIYYLSIEVNFWKRFEEVGGRNREIQKRGDGENEKQIERGEVESVCNFMPLKLNECNSLLCCANRFRPSNQM